MTARSKPGELQAPHRRHGAEAPPSSQYVRFRPIADTSSICKMKHVRIELACAVCGKNRFSFPEEGGDDSTHVSCEDCGHVVGSMGELKQAFAEAVINRTRRARVRRKPREHDA